MKIHSLYYKNLLQGWELEEVHFSDLNVLVGISGVGKTQIVNVIQNLAEMANGLKMAGIEWNIHFSVGKEDYVWKGDFVKEPLIISPHSEIIIYNHIISEKLTLNGIDIAIQSERKIKYKEQNLPKIGEGESLIKLLSEPDIEAARKGFLSIIHKDYRNYQEESMTYKDIKQLMPDFNLLSDIERSNLPLLVKLYMIDEKFPEIYEQIRQDYLTIFPQVKDVLIVFDGGTQNVNVCLELYDKEGIIPQSQISSGMFRTLMAIVELYLCHEESLFLLDEFENSLGFNCLDKMFELIENKAYSGENQFILTTHNPYIIRNTDLSAIKIVTRKGNKIIVKNAIDMGLAESAQDNFFKIINLKEFREGVSA